MRNWVQHHKKKIKRGLIVILVLAAALYGICFYMSYKAADIFNKTVAERQLFPGTVTVERLTATPGGTVSFENLLWVRAIVPLTAILSCTTASLRPNHRTGTLPWKTST